MTADQAAMQFGYERLSGDATLAGLIDERAEDEPAVYSWGLAEQNAPDRHIILDTPVVSDQNIQGATTMTVVLLSVSVRGSNIDDIRAASGRADELLRRSKGVVGGFTITCERISIQPMSQVDSGKVHRHVTAVYRVFVASPEQ